MAKILTKAEEKAGIKAEIHYWLDCINTMESRGGPMKKNAFAEKTEKIKKLIEKL